MKAFKRFILALVSLVVNPFGFCTLFTKKKTNDEKLWRNNRSARGELTAHSVIVCAGDAIFEKCFLRIVIRHVRTLQGRGFMASVEDIRGAGSANGSVFLIEDGDAYTQAVLEGHTLLVRKLDERSFGSMSSDMKRKAHDPTQARHSLN